MTRTKIQYAAAVVVMLLPLPVAADAEQNEQIMAEAAKRLEYQFNPDNRAFMLTKLETVVAPVAVVFGYADNEAACRQFAEVLSQSLRTGTFDCRVIK